MTAITVWPSIYEPAAGRRVSLGALLERVKAPRTYPSKQSVGRWSAATFRNDYRLRDNFIAERMIVVDVGDVEPVTRAGVQRAFTGLHGFAFSSWSHTRTAPRWRVGLTLSCPVDADAHDRLLRYVVHLQDRVGIVPDVPSSRSAAQCWALPARHDGDAYEHFDLAGAPLDVGIALGMFPKVEPLPEPAARTRDESSSRRFERASKYLGAMPPAISGSGGHAAAFKAACALVRGFDLNPDDALRLLVEEFNPRCTPPWSLRELRHKIKQATRSRLPRGFLAEKRRVA